MGIEERLNGVKEIVSGMGVFVVNSQLSN